jgi:hypothetical protein
VVYLLKALFASKTTINVFSTRPKFMHFATTPTTAKMVCWMEKLEKSK